MPKAPGGCRTPRRRCPRASSPTSPASASPTSAPRPAARPRRWPQPAPMSPPSTYRPSGSGASPPTSRRLGLTAEVVTADILAWTPPEPFDAILLDAPCTATGTIRRHPDIAWVKRPEDVQSLADLQGRMIDRAVAWLKPGGVLVFSTCSLEPEEGEHQMARALHRHDLEMPAGRAGRYGRNYGGGPPLRRGADPSLPVARPNAAIVATASS